MIKSLADQISRWMEKITGPELSHFSLEVVNWKNVVDDQLPPDIELDIFYQVQDQLDALVLDQSIVDDQNKITELKVYQSLSRTRENFEEIPVYIQQEIIQELWRHHRQRS